MSVNFGPLQIWSRISLERGNISKIGKTYELGKFLLRLMKKVRWTLVHKRLGITCEFGPNKKHFFGDYISVHMGCCTHIFTRARDYQTLLLHTPTGTGPPKKFNRENLKFGLKFSVYASISSELMGISSQIFIQTTCREPGVTTWVQFFRRPAP